MLSGKMYLVLDLKLHFQVVLTPYGLTVWLWHSAVAGRGGAKIFIVTVGK